MWRWGVRLCGLHASVLIVCVYREECKQIWKEEQECCEAVVFFCFHEWMEWDERKQMSPSISFSDLIHDHTTLTMTTTTTTNTNQNDNDNHDDDVDIPSRGRNKKKKRRYLNALSVFCFSFIFYIYIHAYWRPHRECSHKHTRRKSSATDDTTQEKKERKRKKKCTTTATTAKRTTETRCEYDIGDVYATAALCNDINSTTIKHSTWWLKFNNLQWLLSYMYIIFDFFFFAFVDTFKSE